MTLRPNQGFSREKPFRGHKNVRNRLTSTHFPPTVLITEMVFPAKTGGEINRRSLEEEMI
jgi:hypothetical protein